MSVQHITGRSTCTPPEACYIFNLPTELLVETITWLYADPNDILSLSYTCRQLRSFLIDPDSSYVWRQARERFVIIKAHVIDKPDSHELQDKIKSYKAPGSRLQMITLPGEEVEMYLQIVDHPIPSPIDGMSEYTLIRMLFGPKTCRVCNKNYTGPLESLALRYSMCTACKNAFIARGRKPVGVVVKRETWTILNRIHSLSGLSVPIRDIWLALWTSILRQDEGIGFEGPQYTLSALWDPLLEELLKPESIADIDKFIKITLKERTERVTQIEKHARALKQWYSEYVTHITEIRQCIRSSAHVFASSHGFDIEDMRNAAAYKVALHNATQLQRVEIVTSLKNALTQLEVQTLKINTERMRSLRGVAERARHSAIERFYTQFKFENNIKPCYDTFRGIQILRALQNGISVAGVTDEGLPRRDFINRPISKRTDIDDALKNTMVLDLVNASLGQWRADAVSGARKLLGYEITLGKRVKKRGKQEKGTKITSINAEAPNSHLTVPKLATSTSSGTKAAVKGGLPKIWRSVPRKLDPELRVTSWFVCTRCSNMDPEYKRMRVLDFRGLCAHTCREKNWSKSQQKSWNIGVFALSPRAIDTATQMVEILQLDPEDIKTDITCLTGWWTCNQCPAWMSAMIWADLLRHCQRHPIQSISQVSEEEAKQRREALGFQQGRLSFADLLTEKHKAEARIKQLACVHCRPNPISSTESSQPQKIMDIHSIRQHMKAKHHVEDCRNEDYYYILDNTTQKPPIKRGPKPRVQEQDESDRIYGLRAVETFHGMTVYDVRY